MRNWWIRFGCFLTGYNYSILRNSSEMAIMAVKRYTAAMIIVCILWSFIGYTFTQRYLQSSLLGSISGALIAVIGVVQIEKQIILSPRRNIGLLVLRTLLAFLMAFIGAVIIDQIILKQDIELEKISYIGKRVDQILPSKTKELQNQIFSLDTTIQAKEREKQLLIDDISKTPYIKKVNTQTQSIPVTITKRDSLGNINTAVIMKPSTTIVVSNEANPKQAFIAPLDSAIASMRAQKIEKNNALLNIRPALENEIKEKVGFLDELKVMYSLVSNSLVALVFWSIWFLFFIFIEILVLVSKIGDKINDYEKTVLHQMNIQIRKLDLLAKMSEGN